MGINDEIKKLINDGAKSTILMPEFRGENNPACVVYDGIVSESFESDAHRHKILYLLKETTDKKLVENSKKHPEEFCIDSGHITAWDFIKTTHRVATEQGDKPKNWENLCYWTEVFKQPNRSFTSAKRCGENLLSVALVNIKKTPGESTSDDALLRRIASDEKYGKLIREEINMIKPNIVVCCGTYEYAETICFTGTSIENTGVLDCGAKYFVCNKFLFVEFVHPSVRINKAAPYAYAKEVFGELKKRRLLK